MIPHLQLPAWFTRIFLQQGETQSHKFPWKMPIVKLQQLSGSHIGVHIALGTAFHQDFCPWCRNLARVGSPTPQPASSTPPGDISAVYVHTAAFKTCEQSAHGAKCLKQTQMLFQVVKYCPDSASGYRIRASHSHLSERRFRFQHHRAIPCCNFSQITFFFSLRKGLTLRAGGT